jgi:type IX secretion system PorP/SprF family membrane protein
MGKLLQRKISLFRINWSIPLYAISLLMMVSVSTELRAQDIPLFSQKLTNSFMYNPALAGHTHGSVTFSYKQSFAKVEGAPKNYFLSFHTPFANHRFGFGANVFQEDINFLKNTYVSSAFAYHLRFSKFTSLSFGVSGEYNSIGMNGTSNSDINDPAYQDLAKYGIQKYDVSFGTHYQNRFMKAGVAMNRLASTWLVDTAAISNYFSSFVQGIIPIRGGEDILEPYVAFRKLSETNELIDIGLFYTYNNKIIIGASYRSGGLISGTIAFKFNNKLLIGYSRETLSGGLGGYVGSASEYAVRYDFNDDTYKERFRSDYKEAVAIRRKTMSSPGKSNNPKQLHRKTKKIQAYSPNRRYQNMKKIGSPTKYKSKNKGYSSHKKKKHKPAKRRR